MAQACLLATALIVVLSAFVRHRGLQGFTAGGDVLVARVVHRVAASVTLILVFAMAFGSFTTRPALRREGALTLGLLAVALALAALGVVTPGSRLPAVTLGNLLGGFAMLALSARLIMVTGQPRQRDAGLARTADLVAILLLLDVALGVLASAAHGGAGMPLAHWLAGLVAAAAVVFLGLLAWQRGRRRRALALAGLLSGVVVLGVFIGGQDSSLPAVLLHNLGAAALLAMAWVTRAGPGEAHA